MPGVIRAFFCLIVEKNNYFCRNLSEEINEET